MRLSTLPPISELSWCVSPTPFGSVIIVLILHIGWVSIFKFILRCLGRRI